MHFSGSYIAKFCARNRIRSWQKPRVLAAALRASDLQVCLHTTLSPYKKPVSTCVNTGLTCMLCGASSAPRTRALVSAPRDCTLALPATSAHPHPRAAAATCAYAKRSTPSLETRAKNSGSSSGALSPKTRASRKMRSPSSRRLSSPVRSVAMTSPFST